MYDKSDNVSYNKEEVNSLGNVGQLYDIILLIINVLLHREVLAFQALQSSSQSSASPQPKKVTVVTVCSLIGQLNIQVVILDLLQHAFVHTRACPDIVDKLVFLAKNIKFITIMYL
jgi:hypothetical protein